MSFFNKKESMRSKIGAKVENFTFSSYNPVLNNFEDHSFSEYISQGSWILLFFYPADFTFVCPTELSDLSTICDELEKMNVVPISFSTDTKYAHLAWKTSEKLISNVKFLMGSDTTGIISQYFGVYDYKVGHAMRGSFLINPEGVLVLSEVNYYDVGRNSTELLRKINGCIYLSQNPNHACPAKWKKGDKVLIPVPDLVNKVYNELNLPNKDT